MNNTVKLNSIHFLSGETVTRIPFSADTTEWQYASGVVEMPEKDAEWTTFEIKSIDVGAEFGNNCNKVIFDKFGLVRDTAVKISYDANGNVESAAVDNEDPYTYEYDENDNLVMIRDEEGNQYRAYTYDAEGNLLSVKDEDNVEIEAYEYDANGKLINSSADGAVTSYGYTAWGTQSSQSVTKTVGDVLYTVSEAYGYNSATKKLESETDSFGNTTAYGYNSDLWLTDITDANGNKTEYTYSRGELATQYADVNKNGVCDEGEPIVGYTYDAWGNITAVETGTASYTFAYNGADLPLAVYVEGNEAPLVTYLYNSTLTETTGIQYANGLTVTYEYDTIGNISKVLENGVAVAEYEYDSNMNLISATDNGAETEYCYDEAGTLLYTSKNCNGHTVVTYSETDEETGETRYITKLDGAEIVYKSVYDEENDISKYVLPNLAEITSDEDELGRTSHIYLKNSAGENILSCTYAYVDKQVGDNLATSEYISSMTYTNGKTYTYTYDAVGNITSVYDGTYTTSYVYDSLYQLVRENNEKLDTTWTYTYDTAGNILAKTEYDYTVGELGNAVDTVTYTYDSVWGDQLVNYDGTGISYDSQGNPLNWRDGLTFTWSGRELSSITDGTKVYTYEYNADGIRTKTTINYTDDPDYSLTYEYILDENNNVIAVYRNGAAYGEYYFDESGSPIGYRYNNRNYWYTKNLQGDITRVESEDGELYVEYDYDAWGNFTIDYSDSRARLAIERVNIYTYRGYIYDRDTGLYYLQSRYYDPVVGRFINADDTSYLGTSGTMLAYNLYAYCENNSINCYDPYGNLSFRLKVSVIGGISYGLYKINALTGMKLKGWAWAKLIYTFVNGFIVGFVAVMSFFSLSKTLLKSVAFGILNTAYEFALGNIKNAGQLLSAFIDGYGGHLAPGLLSDKLSFFYDTILFLNKYLAIKVY